MMTGKYEKYFGAIKLLAAGFLFAGMVAVAACGSSSDNTVYSVEVMNADSLTNGKSTFQLKVTKPDGSAATGIASKIKLHPVMHMADMTHSTPVPADAVTETSTPGVYDCTVYFLMASVDSSGMSMGRWELQTTIGSNTSSNDLTVRMAMGNTVRNTMKNSGDMFMTMSGSPESMRSYYIFSADTTASSGGYEVKYFVATVEEGLDSYPAVSAGTKLKKMDGSTQMTISSVSMQASTDGSSWTDFTCNSSGYCSGNLAGMMSGMQSAIKVKLAVNGNAYTTDGNADTGSNGYCTFTNTPGGGSMGGMGGMGGM